MFFNKKKKESINPHIPSSEEEYIKNYLDESGIDYISEYKINGLKGDSKSYRKVDFYLPKHNVYVEYFGLYNANKEIRGNYDEKVRVYLKNHLPSVFLYPHELGILDYAFHKKMLKVLRTKKFEKKSNILKYKYNRWKSKLNTFVVPLIAGFGYLCFDILTFETGLDEHFAFIISMFCGFVAIVYILSILSSLLNTFYYDE